MHQRTPLQFHSMPPELHKPYKWQTETQVPIHWHQQMLVGVMFNAVNAAQPCSYSLQDEVVAAAGQTYEQDSSYAWLETVPMNQDFANFDALAASAQGILH